MQVQKLEEEIGTLIFDRKKQPLEPTKTGELIVLKARQIVREVAHLKEMVNTDKEEMKGLYRIGIIPTIAPYIVPSLIQRMSVKYKDLQFQLEEMKTDDIIHALKHDQLDLGILASPLLDAQIREIPMYYEPFLLYVSEQHALFKKKQIIPSDLNTDGLWLLNQGHCLRDQVLNICTLKSKKKEAFKYESGSIETLMNIINLNNGFTLVPELAVQQQDASQVKRFKDPQPVREISLVCERSFTKEKLLSTLQQEIMELVPASFKKSKKMMTVKWR